MTPAVRFRLKLAFICFAVVVVALVTAPSPEPRVAEFRQVEAQP